MRAEPTTTQLLHDARAGDDDALDRLFPRLYDELRQLAHARLRRHRQSDTLSTTALVHEAYLKLTAGQAPTVADRTHFFALAARAMRFVLVSYARDRTAQKRGGGEAALAFDEALGDGLVRADAEAADLLTLDHALERLATYSARLAEVVELRFFGGLQHEEIAAHTGRSVATVKRDWRRARAWLYHAMSDAGEQDSAALPEQDDPRAA